MNTFLSFSNGWFAHNENDAQLIGDNWATEDMLLARSGNVGNGTNDYILVVQNMTWYLFVNVTNMTRAELDEKRNLEIVPTTLALMFLFTLLCTLILRVTFHHINQGLAWLLQAIQDVRTEDKLRRSPHHRPSDHHVSSCGCHHLVDKTTITQTDNAMVSSKETTTRPTHRDHYSDHHHYSDSDLLPPKQQQQGEDNSAFFAQHPSSPWSSPSTAHNDHPIVSPVASHNNASDKSGTTIGGGDDDMIVPLPKHVLDRSEDEPWSTQYLMVSRGTGEPMEPKTFLHIILHASMIHLVVEIVSGSCFIFAYQFPLIAKVLLPLSYTLFVTSVCTHFGLACFTVGWWTHYGYQLYVKWRIVMDTFEKNLFGMEAILDQALDNLPPLPRTRHSNSTPPVGSSHRRQSRTHDDSQRRGNDSYYRQSQRTVPFPFDSRNDTIQKNMSQQQHTCRGTPPPHSNVHHDTSSCNMCHITSSHNVHHSTTPSHDAPSCGATTCQRRASTTVTPTDHQVISPHIMMVSPVVTPPIITDPSLQHLTTAHGTKKTDRDLWHHHHDDHHPIQPIVTTESSRDLQRSRLYSWNTSHHHERTWVRICIHLVLLFHALLVFVTLGMGMGLLRWVLHHEYVILGQNYVAIPILLYAYCAYQIVCIYLFVLYRQRIVTVQTRYEQFHHRYATHVSRLKLRKHTMIPAPPLIPRSFTNGNYKRITLFIVGLQVALVVRTAGFLSVVFGVGHLVQLILCRLIPLVLGMGMLTMVTLPCCALCQCYVRTTTIEMEEHNQIITRHTSEQKRKSRSHTTNQTAVS